MSGGEIFTLINRQKSLEIGSKRRDLLRTTQKESSLRLVLLEDNKTIGPCRTTTTDFSKSVNEVKKKSFAALVIKSWTQKLTGGCGGGASQTLLAEPTLECLVQNDQH